MHGAEYDFFSFKDRILCYSQLVKDLTALTTRQFCTFFLQSFSILFCTVAQFSCQPGMDGTPYPDFLNTWWVGDFPGRR